MDQRRRNEIHQPWAFASVCSFFTRRFVAADALRSPLRKAINTLTVIHKLPPQRGFKFVDHLQSVYSNEGFMFHCEGSAEKLANQRKSSNHSLDFPVD